MLIAVYPWLVWVGTGLAAAAMAYSIIARIAVWLPIRLPTRTVRTMPGVTLLKPLCGADPATYECLRSFCEQAYPEFQIVFGVSDENDPSLPIVERLQREFPERDLSIVVDRRQHGTNRKVSNLINMMPRARHDMLVLSDSDVKVPPDYLAKLAAPLLDANVGIVTCCYAGNPQPGLWSLLGAMFINDWFTPSVRVAAMLGSRFFAFGATIGIRREVLAKIGGFAAIADQLADDYRLGELTRRLGLRTVLSDMLVETFVVERSCAELVRHELRWLRTIRALRPLSYAFCFVTFGIPVAALGALLAGGGPAATVMFGITVAARVALHVTVGASRPRLVHLLLLPLRDTLNLGLWAWSFVTRRVQWRDDRYRLGRDGSVQLVVRI